MTPSYRYSVFVHRVLDGDSVDGTIDLGFRITIRQSRIRLYGINSAELRSSDEAERLSAQVAKERLRGLVEGKQIVVEFAKEREKYGGFLGTIFVDGLPEGVETVNKLLVAEGLAKPYHP